MNKKLTKEQKQILKRCLWDRPITPEQFYGIIKGQYTYPGASRAFYIARLLEYANWFDIKKIFKPKEICALWNDEVRRYVRAKSIKEGMDFACKILHGNTLSYTR